MTPVTGDPDGVRTRGRDPFSWDPDIRVPVPAVIAGSPDPAVMGTGTWMFNDDGWRADLNVDALRQS